MIIGYGNPLRGDDGVGWRVIEALEGLVPEGAAVAVHLLTPELAEPISRARCVIFVDAAVGDLPGQMSCFPLAPAPGRPGSHETNPAGLLALAAELFGRCPPAHMVTIAGGSFDVGEELTAPVEAAVAVAAAAVRALVHHADG